MGTWQDDRSTKRPRCFSAAFVLGPPIGGIIIMALLQVLPWLADGLADPAPQFGANLIKSLLLPVPLSYFVGGYRRCSPRLGAGRLFRLGRPHHGVGVLAASLIYPAVLSRVGPAANVGSPETLAARAAQRRDDSHRVGLCGARLLLSVAQYQVGAGLRRLGPGDVQHDHDRSGQHGARAAHAAHQEHPPAAARRVAEDRRRARAPSARSTSTTLYRLPALRCCAASSTT